MTEKIFKRLTKEDIEDRLREHLDDFTPEIVSPIYSMIAVSGESPEPERRDYFVRKIRSISEEYNHYEVCFSTPLVTEDYFSEHAFFKTIEEAENFIKFSVRYMTLDEIEESLDGRSVSAILDWLLIEDGIGHIPAWARRSLMKFFYYALETLDAELREVIVEALLMSYENEDQE